MFSVPEETKTNILKLDVDQLFREARTLLRLRTHALRIRSDDWVERKTGHFASQMGWRSRQGI
jgi:hypothetical protein